MKLIFIFLAIVISAHTLAQQPPASHYKHLAIERLRKQWNEKLEFSRHIQSNEDKDVVLNIYGSRGFIEINISKIKVVEDYTKDTITELLHLEINENLNYSQLIGALSSDEIAGFDPHPDHATIYLCQNEGHYSFDIYNDGFTELLIERGLREEY